MLVWGVLLTAFACGLASQETHRFIHISEDGKKVAQDIIHDQEENTVLVIIGDVSMYKGYIPSVNLHDFNTRYVAFKDIRRQTCMVSPTPYPSAMPELYRLGVTNVTKVYKAKTDTNPLTYDQVNWLAGPKIADFCKDYSTFYRQLIPENHVEKRDQPIAAQSSEEGWLCIYCKIESGLSPCGDDILG